MPRSGAAQPRLRPTVDLLAFTARYSGTCPLCESYIRAGRSRIVELPVPIIPMRSFYDAERGFWRDTVTGDAAGRGPNGAFRRLAYAHLKCAKRFDREFGHLETAELARLQNARHNEMLAEMERGRAAYPHTNRRGRR